MEVIWSRGRYRVCYVPGRLFPYICQEYTYWISGRHWGNRRRFRSRTKALNWGRLRV